MDLSGTVPVEARPVKTEEVELDDVVIAYAPFLALVLGLAYSA
jgi:hypothetical protein